MKVNQDMLNKYAAGKCSATERLLVERWLDHDSWDTIVAPTDVKDEIGAAIWTGVGSYTTRSKAMAWWKIAAAASIVAVLSFSFLHLKPKALDSHTFANESLVESKFFSEDHYDVVLSGNANAQIDLINNKLTFSGDFMIKPKKDFELLDSEENTLVFKAGREYFVSDSPDFGKIVAFQKSDMAFLPSQIQTKIREQFQCI